MVQGRSVLKPLEIALDHADISQRSSARNRVELLIGQHIYRNDMAMLGVLHIAPLDWIGVLQRKNRGGRFRAFASSQELAFQRKHPGSTRAGYSVAKLAVRFVCWCPEIFLTVQGGRRFLSRSSVKERWQCLRQ